MLQIKNTLGGGKPEGLYAWKKSSVVMLDSITTKVSENYELGTATFDTTVYYSTSYTFDESTGIYTLVNPQSANLAYNGSGGVATVRMEKSKYYIWGSTSSDKIYTTNDDSTYNVGIKNASGSVYLESTATNEIYDIHSAKTEYIFLDYIVSDKETAYPDGGEKGGYWYERVGDLANAFGYTKMAIDYYVATENSNSIKFPHSLGEEPKLAIVLLDYTKGKDITFDSYRRMAMKVVGGGARTNWIKHMIAEFSATNNTSSIYDVSSTSFTPPSSGLTNTYVSSGGYYLYVGIPYTIVTFA